MKKGIFSILFLALVAVYGCESSGGSSTESITGSTDSTATHDHTGTTDTSTTTDTTTHDHTGTTDTSTTTDGTTHDHTTTDTSTGGGGMGGHHGMMGMM